jgi:hypothetical protein
MMMMMTQTMNSNPRIHSEVKFRASDPSKIGNRRVRYSIVSSETLSIYCSVTSPITPQSTNVRQSGHSISQTHLGAKLPNSPSLPHSLQLSYSLSLSL